MWAVTSLALLAWSSTVDHGIIVAAIYVGANAIAVAITWTRRPPVPPGFLTAMGWAAAFQLPVLLLVYFDPNDMKARVDAQRDDGITEAEWNNAQTLLGRPGLRRQRNPPTSRSRHRHRPP